MQKYINKLRFKISSEKFIHFLLLIFVLKSSLVFALPVPQNFPDTSNNFPADTAPKRKSSLESKVEYSARDSMIFDVESEKLLLFGNANVKYETTNLKAGYIELGMSDNILFASELDSAGKKTGAPYFDDNGQHFTAEQMRYNFKTKKGKIIKAITQEGDGYLHGESIKKNDDDILYIKDGKYTTCSHPEPHFHIEATKLKVIKDDKIITGPAYLVVENAPTPLAIPFGMFPNKKERTSGIVIPQYGQSPNLGFFLQEGGFYFGFSDYMDLKLSGDVYSRGSWAGKATSAYKKRYKYNGLLKLEYSEFLIGEKELPEYQKNTNFFIKWKHAQDPKNNPTSNISADVNLGSSNNFRNNINTPTVDFFTNIFASNISYQKTFTILKIPSNINVSAGHDQNTRTRKMNLKFPQVSFNMNRFTPFKRKTRIGEMKFYENIGFSYQSFFINSLSTYDTLLIPKLSAYYNANKSNPDFTGFPKYSLHDSLRYGMSHNIPISTSVKFLKYMTFNPQLNYSEKWYLQSINKSWDADSAREITDTIHRFSRFGEYNASANFTTTVYGMYSFKSQYLQAIRHMVIPSFGFSYRPDFSDLKYNYYREYIKPGILKTDTAIKFSRFQNGVLGGPSVGETGSVNFSLTNNLEMKIGSKKDTVSGTKKIKIFEVLSFASSYNLLADSMKLAPIQIAGRTNLFQALNLNFSGVLNPYKIDLFHKDLSGNFSPQRVDTLVWQTSNWWKSEHPFGYLTNGQIAVSLNMNGDKKKNQQKTSAFGTEAELAQINSCLDCYVDFNVPWSLNVNYNIIYQKPFYKVSIANTMTFSGDVRLTPNWKIGYNSGYDFTKKEFTYTSMDIYRDLHCWEMRLSLIPFGTRKSYVFNINVKSAVLQDLKLTRRRNWFDQ